MLNPSVAPRCTVSHKDGAFVLMLTGVEADPPSAGLADGWAVFFLTFHLTECSH